MTNNTQALTVAAATGAALTGGVFFAFSSFVMSGLDRLPGRDAIVAMQAINKAAPSPLFMTALFGTAVLSVGTGVVAVRRIDDPSAVYLLVGSGLYLAGVVLTVAYHVPRNDALALVDANRLDATEIWRNYATGWTAWNHVRTFTSLASAVMFILALIAE